MLLNCVAKVFVCLFVLVILCSVCLSLKIFCVVPSLNSFLQPQLGMCKAEY